MGTQNIYRGSQAQQVVKRDLGFQIPAQRFYNAVEQGVIYFCVDLIPEETYPFTIRVEALRDPAEVRAELVLRDFPKRLSETSAYQGQGDHMWLSILEKDEPVLVREKLYRKAAKALV